ADSSISKEITRLGLKYGLMTKYTSFIAIDEEIVEKDGKPVTVKQPLPLPEGVSNDAVGGGRDGMVTYTGNARRLSSSSNETETAASLNLSLNSVTTVNEEAEEIEEEIFTVVETQPQFPGGEDSLYSFIYTNLRYPQEAIDNGIEGNVYITFVIEKDGSITNIKILRDIGYGCGAEAVRVLKMMPKWIPGSQRGKPVRVQFNMPIKFELKQ
ncbi:MAG: TonB family protein, partial [Bacteroidales bacterium]|nr:TonB family protein [Bacteroidales bacterium]